MVGQYVVIYVTNYWQSINDIIKGGSVQLIGSTLAFGSRGTWFKSRWGEKIFSLVFLSSNLMVVVYF